MGISPRPRGQRVEGERVYRGKLVTVAKKRGSECQAGGRHLGHPCALQEITTLRGLKRGTSQVKTKCKEVLRMETVGKIRDY